MRSWVCMAWLTVMSGCAPKGEPTLELTLSARSVSDGTPVGVRVAGIKADGTVGTGEVTISSEAGSLSTPVTVTLDAFGTGRTELICDPGAEPACASSVRVVATWTSDKVRVSAEARLNASNAADGGGGGGAGGGGGGGGGTGGINHRTTDQLSKILVDPSGTTVYVANVTKNQVERYTKSGNAPALAVGQRPVGMDFDVSGTVLFVANAGDGSISKVDLASGLEVDRISVPPTRVDLPDTPFSIAVANNGKAFFTTTFAGSGFGGRVMELDLMTGAVRQRVDAWAFGACTEATLLKSSGDHSVIGMVGGDISSGPVFKYTADTDTFTTELDTNGFVSDVAVDATGSRFLVLSARVLIFDSTLARTGVLDRGRSVAMGSDPNFGFTARGIPGDGGVIEKFDTATLVSLGALHFRHDFRDLSDRPNSLSVSADGRVRATLTDEGFVVFGL